MKIMSQSLTNVTYQSHRVKTSYVIAPETLLFSRENYFNHIYPGKMPSILSWNKELVWALSTKVRFVGFSQNIKFKVMA